MGVSRQGLPCVAGFVLTDYKSQSWTMEMVLLGLYGKRGGEEVDRCDLYVQMSRRKSQGLPPRMYPDLIAGNKRFKKASDKTTQAFAARHDGQLYMIHMYSYDTCTVDIS
jgi:hypothetical protein